MLDTNLLTLLTKTGLEDKEARAYLALLELGNGTVTHIAEKAGLKRAIVYHVLQRLIELGYATEIAGPAVKHFAPATPDKILQNVKTVLDDFRYLLPMFQFVKNKNTKQSVEYFEGREAVVSVYRSFQTAKEERYVSSIQQLQKLIPNELDTWIKRYNKTKKKVVVKMLLADSPEDRAFVQRIKNTSVAAKILPIKFEADFAIIGDALNLTSFDPIAIAVIKSKPVAQAAANLFDWMWRQAK